MSTGRWRGFTLQLLALTVLPLAALSLVIAFSGVALHQRAMRTLVGERDERAARAVAAVIDEQLRYRSAAVHNLALQAAGSVTPDHALADAVFFLPHFDAGLALFTAEGQLLAASRDPTFWQGEELLHTVLNGEQPFVTVGSGAETMLSVATAPDGTIAVGAFDPARLVQQALSDVFGPVDQASAWVVRRDGTLIYQVGPVQPPPDLLQQSGVAEALTGQSGTTYRTTEAGEHVIVFSPITEVGWALVIEEPWHLVADPLLRTTEIAPLVLVPVVVIGLVGLWFGVRQIVQPLQSLARKATDLAWGDFMAIEEPVGGIQEIQRLQAELIHMAQKVQLAQKGLRGYLGAVTSGQEEERRRLARELHDDTIQSLIALNQRVQLAQLTLAESKPTPLADQLAELQLMTTRLIDDVRRLTHNLRPIYLDDLGLTPALQMLAQDAQRALGIPVRFQATGALRRLQPSVELALYRVAQEALSNIGRHAQATQTQVYLSFSPEAVEISICDDGRGFSVPESPSVLASGDHFGLLGMQERAELIGARLEITSAPGEGTQVSVTVPTLTI